MAGRLSWERLFDDAIELSTEGSLISSALGRDLQSLWPQLKMDPGISRVFGDAYGVPLETGAILRQPALSESLSRIAKKGASDFYEGDLARKLVAGMQTLGSRVDARDFKRQDSQAVEAIARDFKGHIVSTAPPNSQGFTLLQLLGAMEMGGLVLDTALDAGVVGRLFSLANQERETFLGDPAVSKIDLSKLLSIERVKKLLNQAKSGNSSSHPPKPRASGDTVGISAMDSSGLAISSLHSIFYAFGAKVLEPATGIILSNRAASFSLDKSHPGYMTPSSRPPSTLLPVLVDHPDGSLTSISSMGGRSQAQIQAQLIGNIIRGDRPQEAVRKPRYVVGSFGSKLEETVVMEPGMPFTRAQLASQTVIPIDERPSNDDRCGHAQIVQNRDGLMTVGTDPRADGVGDFDDD
jgi:gamma-glutamyltranspeptidase/glutathione hydrolase